MGYKLNCFSCYRPFKSKKDVCRDSEGKPLCVDCLWEILAEYWESEFIEDIICEIRDKFGGSYKEFNRWFYENHEICNGPLHDIEWWVHKSQMEDGLCSACRDYIMDKESE